MPAARRHRETGVPQPRPSILAQVQEADNPLLRIGSSLAFGSIRSEHVVPATERLVTEAARALDAVIECKEPRTYENTILALERVSDPLVYALDIVTHLESVTANPDIRAALEAMHGRIGTFLSQLRTDARVWTAIRDYRETEEGKQLTGLRRRHLDRTVAEFQRSGIELADDKKERLREVIVRIGGLTNRFAQNMVDATADYELVIPEGNETVLAGVPASVVDSARRSAASVGEQGFRFTLADANVQSILTHADDPDFRREIYLAYNCRASSGKHDNREIINEILELRREYAQLLGHRTFADFALDDYMARTGDGAIGFVVELRERLRPAFERERDSLEAFRRKLEGSDAPALMAWDILYYAEKQRTALYDLDEAELREYFPLERVLQGLFELASTLYDVEIRPVDDAQAWDPTVRKFELVKDGTPHAYFYLDLFARPSKRAGGWTHGLLVGRADNPQMKEHVAFVVMSASPPVEGEETFLTHSEVRELFHEFGHLMHHCLTEVSVRSLAGIEVARDFIELPSQLLENWTWEGETLARITKHRTTGEPIPSELIHRLRRSQTHRAATEIMHQLGLAAADLALHSTWDPKRDGDATAYARTIMLDYEPVRLPQDHSAMTTFAHLFAYPIGYAAAYYSYRWAEVLDADVFTRFKEEGLYDPEVGRQFRDTILARGNSEDPMELYLNFMGRGPRSSPLLRRLGVL